MCLLISNNLSYFSCAKFYPSNFNILDFFIFQVTFFYNLLSVILQTSTV